MLKYLQWNDLLQNISKGGQLNNLGHRKIKLCEGKVCVLESVHNKQLKIKQLHTDLVQAES